MNFVCAPPELHVLGAKLFNEPVIDHKVSQSFVANLEADKKPIDICTSIDLFVQYTDSRNSVSSSVGITNFNHKFHQFTFQNNNEDLRKDDSHLDNSCYQFDEAALVAQGFDICATYANPDERNDLSQINIGNRIEFSALENEAIELKAKLNNINNLYEINQCIEYFESQKTYYAKLNKFSDVLNIVIESLYSRKTEVEMELARNYIATIKKS